MELLEQGLEGVCQFYSLRVRLQEGAGACRTVLKCAPLNSLLAAYARAWLGHFLSQSGEIQAAVEQVEAALSTLNDLDDTQSGAGFVDPLKVKGRALFERGLLASHNDRSLARRCLEESWSLFLQLKEYWYAVGVMVQLSFLHHNAGLIELAEQIMRQALDLCKNFDEPRRIALVHRQLGFVLLRKGNLREGVEQLDWCANTLAATGERSALALADFNQGLSHLWQGKLEQSFSLLQQAADACQSLGFLQESANAMIYLSIVELHSGAYETLKKNLPARLQLIERIGNQRNSGVLYYLLASCCAAQGDWQAALEHVRRSAAILDAYGLIDDLTMSLSLLCLAAASGGQTTDSRDSLCRLLSIARQHHYYMATNFALAACAVLLALEGQFEPALELYERILQEPFFLNSRWMEHLYGQVITSRAAVLPLEIQQASRERGRKLDPLSALDKAAAAFCLPADLAQADLP